MSWNNWKSIYWLPNNCIDYNLEMMFDKEIIIQTVNFLKPPQIDMVGKIKSWIT